MKKLIVQAFKKDGQLRTTMDDRSREINFLESLKEGEKVIVTIETIDSRRTGTQNNSLHLGFDMVSRQAQEQGITMNAILEKAKAEVDVTPEGIKYNVFHPIMKAMYHVDSTAKLKKIGQVDNVWDKMMHFFGREFEMEYIDFPSEEKPEDKTGYHK